MKQALIQSRVEMNDPRQRFPMKVSGVEDLPPQVRAALHHPSDPRSILRIPSGAYPIRRTVWFVELPFGWRRTPERFLVFGDTVLTVIEIEPGGIVTTTDIPVACFSKCTRKPCCYIRISG